MKLMDFIRQKQIQEEKIMDKNKKNSRKMTSKRLAALIGVALLVMLYIVTLIVAVAGNSASGELLRICFFATLAVPLFIWVYTWIYGQLTGRHTFADMTAGTRHDPNTMTAADPSRPAEGDAASEISKDTADASPTDTVLQQDSPR